jgi:hypothetical protein
MINKITIYTEEIYFQGEKITDPDKISSIIKNQISHLGNFKIYHRPKPKGWFHKFLYLLAGIRY